LTVSELGKKGAGALNDAQLKRFSSEGDLAANM